VSSKRSLIIISDNLGLVIS